MEVYLLAWKEITVLITIEKAGYKIVSTMIPFIVVVKKKYIGEILEWTKANLLFCFAIICKHFDNAHVTLCNFNYFKISTNLISLWMLKQSAVNLLEEIHSIVFTKP